VGLESFDTRRCEVGDKAVIQGVADGSQDLTLDGLLTGRSEVSSLQWCRCWREGCNADPYHPVASGLSIGLFDRDDRVRLRRKPGSRHDPNRRSRIERDGPWFAGEALTDYAKGAGLISDCQAGARSG
jgi:hypothetical protein